MNTYTPTTKEAALGGLFARLEVPFDVRPIRFLRCATKLNPGSTGNQGKDFIEELVVYVHDGQVKLVRLYGDLGGTGRLSAVDSYDSEDAGVARLESMGRMFAKAGRIMIDWDARDRSGEIYRGFARAAESLGYLQ